MCPGLLPVNPAVLDFAGVHINFLVPSRMSAGAATISVNGNAVSRATGTLQIEATAPGIFTQNADGRGVPAAVVLRIAPGGAQTSEPAFACTAAPGSCQPAPIDLGTGQAYLLLFGTGIRNLRAVTEASVTVEGVSVPILYAGDQGQFVGLDQVNLLLPPELAGRGPVELILTVNSKPANTVRLYFQ